MRKLSSLLCAAMLVGAAIAATPAAFAQAAGPVIVVDRGRVWAESAAGKSAQTQLKTHMANVKKELEAESKPLEAEGKSLSPTLKDKNRQQIMEELNKNEQLRTQFQAYVQKLGALEEKSQVRNAEMEATQQRAIQEVLRNADPLILDLMRERKAAVVMEAANVLIAAPEADITGEVIKRLDAKLKTVAVAKVDLAAEIKAAQAAQQQGAAPAAAGKPAPKPQR